VVIFILTWFPCDFVAAETEAAAVVAILEAWRQRWRSYKETVVLAVAEADTALVAAATWANGGDSGNGCADNNQQ